MTEHNRKSERIGRMRHRIKYSTPIKGRDAFGGEIHTWLESNEVWAHFERRQAFSDEGVIAQRVTAEVSAYVTTRYDSTIYPLQRVIFDSIEWEILAVIPDTHKRFMTLEVVNLKPYSTDNWVTPDGDNWIDPDGNAWQWLDSEGNTLTVETAAIATGSLTWTDPTGTQWVLTAPG